MTIDERVDYARKLAEELRGVTQTEWSKWAEYAHREGLEKAIFLANALSQSIMLRPGPKHSYEVIFRVMSRESGRLKGLKREEVSEIIGFAGRWLRYYQAFGAWREEER